MPTEVCSDSSGGEHRPCLPRPRFHCLWTRPWPTTVRQPPPSSLEPVLGRMESRAGRNGYHGAHRVAALRSLVALCKRTRRDRVVRHATTAPPATLATSIAMPVRATTSMRNKGGYGACGTRRVRSLAGRPGFLWARLAPALAELFATPLPASRPAGAPDYRSSASRAKPGGGRAAVRGRPSDKGIPKRGGRWLRFTRTGSTVCDRWILGRRSNRSSRSSLGCGHLHGRARAERLRHGHRYWFRTDGCSSGWIRAQLTTGMSITMWGQTIPLSARSIKPGS